MQVEYCTFANVEEKANVDAASVAWISINRTSLQRLVRGVPKCSLLHVLVTSAFIFLGTAKSLAAEKCTAKET